MAAWSYKRSTGEIISPTAEVVGTRAGCKTPVGIYQVGTWHDDPQYGDCVARIESRGHETDNLYIQAEKTNPGANLVFPQNIRYAFRDSGCIYLQVIE